MWSTAAFWPLLVAAVAFSTVVHEAGHLLAAAAVRIRVEQVVIGHGPVLSSARGGRVDIELRAVPFTGFVRVRLPVAHWPRLRWALVLVAGPTTHMAYAVLLMCVGLSAPVPAVVASAAGVAALLCALTALGNLLPLRDRRTGLDSDGRQLLHLLRHRLPPERPAGPPRRAETFAALRREVDVPHPTERAVAALVDFCALTGEWRPDRERLLGLVHRHDLPPKLRARVANLLAWQPLPGSSPHGPKQVDPSTLREPRRLAELACDLDPSVDNLDTYARVLALSGRHTDAIRVAGQVLARLDEVARPSRSVAAGSALMTILYAHATAGRTAEARAFRATRCGDVRAQDPMWQLVEPLLAIETVPR